MKRVKLKDEEYRQISSIVEKYRVLQDEFDDVQAKLEELDKQKVSLLSRLDLVRAEENKFFSIVEKTHGKGKLDILTMEYIVS